jgi:hypothetical protein
VEVWTLNWGIEDLTAAAILVMCAGIGVAVAGSLVQRRSLRVLLGSGVIAIALAIWAHLAVGIF